MWRVWLDCDEGDFCVGDTVNSGTDVSGDYRVCIRITSESAEVTF